MNKSGIITRNPTLEHELLELHNLGLSLKEIAKRLNVSSPSVGYYIKTRGLCYDTSSPRYALC